MDNETQPGAETTDTVVGDTGEAPDIRGVDPSLAWVPPSKGFAWNKGSLVIRHEDVLKRFSTSYLSPSTAKAMEGCPARWAAEKAMPSTDDPFGAAELGTSAHAVLEDLYDLPGSKRTEEKAMNILLAHSRQMWPGQDDDTFAKRGLWISEVHNAYRGLFAFEDPAQVVVYKTEMKVEGVEVNGVPFKGFIDRVDLSPDGLKVVDYKGLALDTPIPTPTGWTTMGDLRAGDQVIGSDGKATRVVGKSSIHHRDCYRITFSDGTYVICDNVHKWKVTELGRGGRMASSTTRVFETDGLAERFEVLASEGRPRSLVIENSAPIELPEADLPLDPWVLGAWLGDGSANDGGITVDQEDVEAMLSLLQEKWGYVRRATSTTAQVLTPGLPPGTSRLTVSTTERSATNRDEGSCDWGNTLVGESCATRSNRIEDPELLPARTILRRLGVLGNKHVPETYLRASRDQRLALLQGLMDTDGSWNGKRNRAVFVNIDESLANAVAEIVSSLGVTVQRFKYWIENEKRPSTWTYRVEFRPVGFNPFLLPRKATLVEEWQATAKPRAYILATRRSIVDIEKIDSVPTSCIMVEAEDSLYLCGQSMIPTHNSGRKMPVIKWGDSHGDQIRLYAEVLRVSEGRFPVEGSLHYTRLGKTRSVPLTKQKMREVLTHFKKSWIDLNTYVDRAEFPTKTSPLCGWCPLVNACPSAQADGKVDRVGGAPSKVDLGIPVLRTFDAAELTPAARKAANKAPSFDLDFGPENYWSEADPVVVTLSDADPSDDFAPEPLDVPEIPEGAIEPVEGAGETDVIDPLAVEPEPPARPWLILVDDPTDAAPAGSEPDRSAHLNPVNTETGLANQKEIIMSDLLTEDLPYKETANGSLNPNSYASMAVFGLASWAYEEIHNAGLKLTKDNLDALLLTFAQIVDEAQQKITGVTSFQDGTNTRLRGLLHTYVETHPIPFGKSEDEWDVWVATGKKHLSSIAAAALRGYRADLGGKPWQALAIREAGDDFDESAS